MKRLLFALFAALIVATPAGAQTAASTEDVALAAHDVCFGVERGSTLASLATAQGFRPSSRGDGAFVRNTTGFEFRLSITDKTQPGGRVLRMCSLGIWGRIAGISRVRDTIFARARADGFRIGDEAPRAKGGTEQIGFKETPGQTRAIGITINEGNDPTKGANYVIIYGWLL